MSDSLWPHGLQHTRPPCPSPTPKSNSPEIYTTNRKTPINTEITISWESKSPLQIQPVHPQGDQSWLFTERTDVETEILNTLATLCEELTHCKRVSIFPDAGKDWKLEEKGMTGEEMVGWHHQLNGHGFGWTLGVGDGQGGLVCCSPWGHKESDTTEQLNWTDAETVGREIKKPVCGHSNRL